MVIGSFRMSITIPYSSCVKHRIKGGDIYIIYIYIQDGSTIFSKTKLNKTKNTTLSVDLKFQLLFFLLTLIENLYTFIVELIINYLM